MEVRCSIFRTLFRPSPKYKITTSTAYGTMALSKYSPVKCYSEKVVYNLKIVTQPLLVRTSGKEKRSILPSPVLQLQIIDTDGIDITEHCLSYYFIRASIYNGSWTSDDYIRYDELQNKKLIGTTVVSGDFIKWNSTRYLLFNFNNLGITAKGTYRLKFSLFEYNGFGAFQKLCKVKPLKTVISASFTCYSSREFYSKDILQYRDQVMANITEINNNTIDRANDLLTTVPLNIAIKRSRHNSSASQAQTQAHDAAAAAAAAATSADPSTGRKRVSISLNDQDLDILTNFNSHYFSDTNYPASPKRQRSPSVSSFTYEEPNSFDFNADVFDDFLDNLNNAHQPHREHESFMFHNMQPVVMHNGGSASTSGSRMRDADVHARPSPSPSERQSLPNIVVDSHQPNKSALQELTFPDEVNVKTLTDEINKAYSRSQSPVVFLDPVQPSDVAFSIDMDELDNELNKVFSNHSQVEDGMMLQQMFSNSSLQNSPAVSNDHLDRVVSNSSYYHEPVGLQKVLSNNSISNQHDLLADHKFTELQDRFLMNSVALNGIQGDSLLGELDREASRDMFPGFSNDIFEMPSDNFYGMSDKMSHKMSHKMSTELSNQLSNELTSHIDHFSPVDPQFQFTFGLQVNINPFSNPESSPNLNLTQFSPVDMPENPKSSPKRLENPKSNPKRLDNPNNRLLSPHLSPRLN